MAKKKSVDISMENLDGFMRKGAREEIKQNIPTGHFELDFGLHYGSLPSNVDFSTLKDYDPKVPLGLPCGRLVELYGEEGSGKSSLAYRTCGMAQKMGYNALWIDTEHSFEESLAELNGLDVDALYYSKAADQEDPDKIYYAEDIMDKIVAACKNAEEYNIKVIVLDSVANLIPKTVGESSANQETMALLARILSRTLGKVAQYASMHDVLVIFINQIREKPGIMFGNPTTTPGGRALKFNASVRLRMSKRSSKDELIWVEEEDESGGVKKIIVGRNSGMSVDKNRCGPPLLDETGGNIIIDLPVYYRPYFPDIEEIAFNVARQMKLISVRVGTYTWKSSNEKIGDIKIDGKKAFLSNIVGRGLLADFINEIIEKANENGVILPPEILKLDMKKIIKQDEKNSKDWEESANEEVDKEKKDVLSDIFEDEEIEKNNRTKKSTKRGRKKSTS